MSLASHSLILYAGLTVLTASSCLTKPHPYHTSVLCGRDWVQELVDGHHRWIKDSLGVRWSMFLQLCLELVQKGGLRPTRHVDVPEHVALFLWAAVTNLSNRHIAEKFQQSSSTVSQYNILRPYMSLLTCHLQHLSLSREHFCLLQFLRSLYVPPSSRIRSDPKFWLFFKDALGAADGTHISCFPPLVLKPACQDKDGDVSQNSVAAGSA
jgi:hypothetical protein